MPTIQMYNTDSELQRAIERACAKEDRTISKWLQIAAREKLTRDGYLLPGPAGSEPVIVAKQSEKGQSNV